MTDICELNLLEAVGNKADQQALIQRVNDEADRRYKADPSMPRNAHLMEAVDDIAREEAESAQRMRQQLVTQAKSREKLLAIYEGFTETGSNKNTAYRQTLGAAGDAGVAAAQRSLGRFVTEITQEGLYPFLNELRVSKEARLAVARELQQANLKNGKIGITGNKQAAALAKRFQDHVNFYRGQLREFGFKVLSLEGRILKQVWNKERMLQKFSKGEDFAADIYPRVAKLGDTAISDIPKEDALKMLSDFFYETTGLVGRDIEISARNMTLERQTYAVRQAQSREIHLRGAEDSLYVLETYGSGDMGALMSETIRDLGKQVELTTLFGVNPRNNSQWLLERAVSGGAERGNLERGGWGLLGLSPEGIMNTIDGFYDNNAANPALAEVVDTVHNFARAAMLGKASLAAIGDFPTLSAAQRRVGIENASAWAMRLKTLANDMDPAMLREAAGAVEASSVHTLGNVHKYNTLPGVNHRVYNASVWAANKTFELNGLSYMTRKNKQAAYMTFSNKLATLVSEKTPYEKLNQYTKRTLLRGGMTKDDWAKLIRSESAAYMDGKFSLLNTEALDPKLASRVNGVLTAFTNEAIITPDTLTRTMMTLGTQRGTALHALVSQATFMMGYPIAFVNQGFRREIEASGAMSFAMLRYFGALTLAGVAYRVLSDMANGRDRDYTHPEIMVQVLQEGMIYGGGMTIYGETLWKLAGADRMTHHLFFGEKADYRVPVNRPVTIEDFLVGAGAGYLSTLGAGTVGGLYDVVTGDIDEGLSTWTKTAQRTLPFVNLPYTKAAVDAIVFNNLIEMTDPRAIDQAERRWRARTGGDFFLTD